MRKEKKKTEPKRHHFIPSGYLKSFTYAGDSVFYFDKSQPTKGIVTRNRKKILRFPHFYSETNKGTKKPILENKIASEIDDKIPSFVCNVENAIAHGLTIDNYKILRIFAEKLFLNFFYRSPYTRKKAYSHRFAKISRLLTWLSFFVGNLRTPDQKEFNEQYENMIQEIIGNAYSNKENPLSKLSLCFVAPHDTERFMTGSNPVLVQFPKLFQSIGPQNPVQRFYFLPLSPKSGLLFSDQSIGNGILQLNAGSADHLNSLVFAQSTRVVAHDHTLISQFTIDKGL